MCIRDRPKTIPPFWSWAARRQEQAAAGIVKLKAQAEQALLQFGCSPQLDGLEPALLSEGLEWLERLHHCCCAVDADRESRSTMARSGCHCASMLAVSWN